MKKTLLFVLAAGVVALAPLAHSGTPTSIPQPVRGHPRLWLTTNEVARLSSWATPTNAVYQALRTILGQANNNYDTQFFPEGVQNTNWPDFGDSQGYTGLLTEENAFILAFFSLIDPDPVQRSVCAQRAANLIRVAMAEAAKGTLAGAPFRDSLFATYNRANASLETMPLAVDWIYDAVDTNGAPVLSAADKLSIRNGFLAWALECLNSHTAGGDSPAPGAINSPATLLPNNRAYRMAANNYYLGHARLLTLMSLAIDPADDPPLNPALPDSAPTNSLRACIANATGAWLYQEYAMFGDGAQVAADYGLPGGGVGLGLCSGGLPAEGMLYGHCYGFLLGQLLALTTAGYNNTNLAGPQCKLISAPLWDRFLVAWLSALTASPMLIESYMPLTYQMMGYGDMLRLYITPDDMQMFSLLALLDAHNGRADRLDRARWLALNGPAGGAGNVLSRVSQPWNWQESVLYFLLLDPAQPLPADPRPELPTFFYDAPQATLVAQSDWSAGRAMLHWRCSWNSINHQNADGGLFQFFRQGEFLTKEYSGYDNAGYGQSSLFHNTLSLQNTCPAGTPQNLQWFETSFWNTGSQFILGQNAGDPSTAASTGPGYVFAFGDLTPLYNRPSFWTPTNAALDILHASRSLLWLKPDWLVVYDRALSHTAGLFKRFNLCLPGAATLAPRPPGGSFITETLPSGQHLFINSLLPANGTATLSPLAGQISFVAEGDPCQFRLQIEDTNRPANTRFLHVLQGADPGAPSGGVTYLQSLAGTPFEGAAVPGMLALFPVNPVSNNFAGVTYPVPPGVTNHFLAGLAPGAGFTVALQTNGSVLQISVSPGGPVQSDSAGLLVFDAAGAPPVSPPRLLSAGWAAASFNFTALGSPGRQYEVQASTNLATGQWQVLGTVVAGPAGAIQFSEPNPAQGQRFYRLRQ